MMINTIRLGGRYEDKEKALNSLASLYDPQTSLSRIPIEVLTKAREISISEIDARLRNNQALSIEEALSGMLRVVAGTNSMLHKRLFPQESIEMCQIKGAFFLSRMAAKEQYVGLTPEEVCGVVMGATTDLVFTPSLESVLETSGMGADRGWDAKKVKTINASTLSALVAASMGYQAMKHGSYGNTTKVGSTDVPEQFGAAINQENAAEISKLVSRCNFWFNDAHAVKTIHYLSHLLMVETINHVVGPMTPPVSSATRLYKLMGVNHYVHPEVVAKAYGLLHQYGIFNLGGAVIVAGIKRTPKRGVSLSDAMWYRENAYLDEASVGNTLVSRTVGGTFLGSSIVNTKKCIGVEIREEDIKVRNEIPTLMRANELALLGKDPYKTYLALNTAYAISTHDTANASYESMLRIRFGQALDAIDSGAAYNQLVAYVESTGGKFKTWIV